MKDPIKHAADLLRKEADISARKVAVINDIATNVANGISNTKALSSRGKRLTIEGAIDMHHFASTYAAKGLEKLIAHLGEARAVEQFEVSRGMIVSALAEYIESEMEKSLMVKDAEDRRNRSGIQYG